MADLFSRIRDNLKPKETATIGVSISQSGLLEVCVYDSNAKNVKKYANRNIKYNPQTREVNDIEEFKINLLSIYEELSIPNNCSVILSLPSVFFDTTAVPLILDNFAVENVLLGEVEQSYIFKKSEPAISWIEQEQNERTDNKTVVYAAIQKNAIDSFKAALKEIGSKLIAVDNSYSNLINTIPKTELAKEEIRVAAPWNIILITHNSFVILSMTGAKLVEYYEEPIALRSIAKDEIYSTLTNSINNALQNYIANSILLISDSNEVDASILIEKLDFQGHKKSLNQNIFESEQIVEVSSNVLPNYITNITLYALGTALYNTVPETKRLNLMAKADSGYGEDSYTLSVGGVELELTKEMVQAISILTAVIMVAVFGLLIFLIGQLNSHLSNKITDYDLRNTNISAELSKLQEQERSEEKVFDLSATKKEIVKNNKQAILYYNLLSFNIPPSTWITHFYTNSQGAVLIEGKTSSTNNVYLFFKGIKASIANSDLALTKLKYAEGFENVIAYTNKLIYEFELSNSKYTTGGVTQSETGQTNNKESNALDSTKQNIQNKVEAETKPNESAPDLPPIEDVNTQPAQNNTKANTPDLPELPD